MKNFFLLASAASMMIAVNVMGQDITPNKYVFSNVAVGPFEIEGICFGSANRVIELDQYKTPFLATEEDKTKSGNFDSFEGAVTIEKWTGVGDPADFRIKGDDVFNSMQQGINIIDLGGQVGKVLCICGKESNWAPGERAGAQAIGAGDITFFMKCQSGINTRIKIVYQQYSRSALEGGDESKKGLGSQVKTAGGVTKGQIAQVAYTEFATKEPNPDSMGEYKFTFDNTKWRVAEADYSLGTAFPYRMAVGGCLENDAVTLIKSITFTQNPEGEPQASEFIKLTPETSIESALAELNKVSIAVNGNNVVISKLNAGENVAIYNVNGSLVESFVANGNDAQVVLASGLYLIKAQTGIVKALIK